MLKYQIHFWGLITILSLMACSTQEPAASAPDAQQIIDQAIVVHGGEKYADAVVSFDFRDKHYIRERNGGAYTFQRQFQDTAGQVILDVLNNAGLTRSIDGVVQDLTAERAEVYSASVNSVIYFALLPYRLNDSAVNKKYLDTISIKGEPYHKIEVTFNAEGGGEDFEDVFVYWVHQQHHTVDYLAYSYAEKKGTGYRFRTYYNRRTVEGIVFQDYENLKPDAVSGLYPGDMDRLFIDGELELLSKIELEHIQVQ